MAADEQSGTRNVAALLTKQSELNALRSYGFDLAFSEQIDLCGLGIIRYLGIKQHIWISTTPLMDAVSYNLGLSACFFVNRPKFQLFLLQPATFLP